ncbi:MAG: SseB family protein [Polyangiales bacterium]
MKSGWCRGMVSPLNDRARDAFLVLLEEGAKGPGPKSDALGALSLRPVWVATWEPRAEGFRTLINTNGEEALAVFSSEEELKGAAARFDWLEADGSIATHRAIGGDILRHAWTREYAYVVIDIGAAHSLEYDRDEVKQILREMDSSGSFRTSRPPAPEVEAEPPAGAEAASSFRPPEDSISTIYSMMPAQAEKLDTLSERPTKPHAVLSDSEPPTQPRAALSTSTPSPKPRRSSQPVGKKKSAPSETRIEEVPATPANLADGGTYGAASIIPPSKRQPKPDSPDESAARSSRAPKLNSNAPTAPAAQALPSLDPGKLKLPAIGPLGSGPVEPDPPPVKNERPTAKTQKPAAQPATRIPASAIGGGIKLVELHHPPNEDLLKALGQILRGYFEVEWASYCEVGRPTGGASPAVGLRITDSFRDNVTAIIKELSEASRAHGVEIDVLLIDGHDLLRKARERGFVFYPWKPKPFGA